MGELSKFVYVCRLLESAVATRWPGCSFEKSLVGGLHFLPYPWHAELWLTLLWLWSEEPRLAIHALSCRVMHVIHPFTYEQQHEKKCMHNGDLIKKTRLGLKQNVQLSIVRTFSTN